MSIKVIYPDHSVKVIKKDNCLFYASLRCEGLKVIERETFKTEEGYMTVLRLEKKYE